MDHFNSDSTEIPQVQYERHRNLTSRLADRELGLNNHAVYQKQREFHLNLVPNQTLYDVKMPMMAQYLVLRRFSPCGNYLVTMSRNHRCLVLYRYKSPGMTSLEELQRQAAISGVTLAVKEQDGNLMHYPFESLFSFMYQLELVKESELICKDFCLFTQDKQHMILASAKQHNLLNMSTTDNFCEPTVPKLRNPGTITINGHDDITIWLINVESGQVMDRLLFKSDYIFLANHSGVTLHGNTLGVTSVKHQCVYFADIVDGKFHHRDTIGWFMSLKDEELVELQRERESLFQEEPKPPISPVDVEIELPEVPEEEHPRKRRRTSSPANELPTNPPVTLLSTQSHSPQPMEEVVNPTGFFVSANQVERLRSLPRRIIATASAFARSFQAIRRMREPVDNSAFSCLKQKILSHLYRKAVDTTNPTERLARLRHFYLIFPNFASLVMWRAHLMDSNRVMFKLGPQESIMGTPGSSQNKSDPPSSSINFFVIYDMISEQVTHVLDNASEEMMRLYETDDSIRGYPFESEPVKWIPSMSNSEFYREAIQKQMYAVWKAKNGGAQQAIKRILAHLPYNSQSYSDSPYWDPSLFSYDDRAVNSYDRSRMLAEFPVKWFDRESGRVKFRLDAGPVPFYTPLIASRPGIDVAPVEEDRNVTPPRPKRLVSYIFHPIEPLVITVTHLSSTGQVVNVHLRNDNLEN